MWDLVQSVLGEVVDLHPSLQIQHPTIRVIDPQTMSIVESVRTDVPDIIDVVGTVTPSAVVSENTKLQAWFRRGQPSPGQPALVWTINGEEGEIRLVSVGSFALHATAYSAPVTIEVRNSATGHVERVGWSWADWQKELPIAARNVGALYEAFADRTDLPMQTFDSATKRLEQVYGILVADDGKQI